MRKNTGNCKLCGAFRQTLHRDHVEPKWRGGLDIQANIQMICANCHEDKTFIENNSPEFKALMSKLGKSHVMTDEIRQRMSAAAIKKATPEFRAKLSQALKGRELSTEHVAKLTERAKERGAKARENRSPVCVNGHPWNEENTYIHKTGWRACRACAREKDALRRAKSSQGTEAS